MNRYRGARGCRLAQRSSIPAHLSAQVEGIAKATLLPLLGGQRLHRFEVEVVVQMQVVEVLPVDEQV
jgi:hypothetical protein